LAREVVAEVSPGAEGKLRAAMTKGATTTPELKEAIGAVEALLGEAKRELAGKQLRERRAAYEVLHAAMDRGEETQLIQALEQARRAEVEADDLSTAEAKLAALQSLTEEQKAAKVAKERRLRSKEQAFLYIKRDDADALRQLLASVEEFESANDTAAGMRWRDWKDHAGRPLLRCAQELRSSRAHAMLKVLLNKQAEEDKAKRATLAATTWGNIALSEAARASLPKPTGSSERVPTASPERTERCPPAQEEPVRHSVAGAQFTSFLPDMTPVGKQTSFAPETTPEAPTPSNDAFGSPIEGVCLATPIKPPENETELRTKAFRAVVADDVKALAEVIVDAVPKELWSEWQNKAGKDLLTLSEERGSSGAYSLLAKALGLLKERIRETYEEREAVWVLFAGAVQPRRATVMEDTDTEANDILLEFWDDDEPASMVDRNFVLKCC